MNINNGKTGNVNIPGALHSTGGDGDGQVGGVVAYAGDVYDETLGKNLKEINQTLLSGSTDSNVIAVALNDLNEKVEEQEKVTSSGLNDLNDKTDNLSKDIEDLEKTTFSSLNDLKDKIDNLNDEVDDNEKTIASKLALDNNNNLVINPKSEVESTATNSLIGGIATVAKGECAFGFGGNALKVYISGNASDGYQLQANVTSSFDPTNFIRPIFENIYKDTYLLDDNTYEKVAKITAVTPNTDGLKISITLDTNLGTLTNALYRLENISKNKSFNFGVFGNTGDWSSIIGYGSYNTGSDSNLLGANNYNAKTYSTLIGTQNRNTGNYSTLIGYNNKATAGNYSTLIGYNNKVTAGNYPCAIGVENTLNAYGYAIGKKNVINANGYAFGFDNFINTNATATAFLIGQKLVCENSRGGFFIGQYNKEYISNDASIANWFAVGCGDANHPRSNAIEVKQNADTYIYGVGGFTGNNSDNSSIKSLNAVISGLETKSANNNTAISTLQNTVSNLSDKVDNNELVTASSLNDLDDRVNTLENAEITAEDVVYDASTEYESGNVGYEIKQLTTQLANVSGGGISQTINAGTNLTTDSDSSASGSQSVTYGDDCIASGDQSFAGGTESIAVGKNSVAVGNKTSAFGEGSFAGGDGTCIDVVLVSETEQYGTHYVTVTLNSSSDAGKETDAMYLCDYTTNEPYIKTHSITRDGSTLTLQVSFDWPDTENPILELPSDKNTAGTHFWLRCGSDGKGSFSSGTGLVVVNESEAAFGTYNVSRYGYTGDPDGYVNTGDETIFSIGCGAGDSSNGRKNAFEVISTGEIFIAGLGNYDGTTLTIGDQNSLLSVINDITNALTSASIKREALTDQITETGSAVTVASLTPNEYHKWGELTSLTITALGSGVSGKMNEYMIEFESGSTATTLSLPSGITWMNNDDPTSNIVANKKYQISIVNNLGVYAEF